MTNQLLACPFCGSHDIEPRSSRAPPGKDAAECWGCGAVGPFCEDDPANVTEAWNERAAAEPPVVHTRWKVVGEVPAGLSVDSVTGIVSGTALASGSFQLVPDVEPPAPLSAFDRWRQELRWIPVSEALPDGRRGPLIVRYLTGLNNDHPHVGQSEFLKEAYGHPYNEFNVSHVTHWMYHPPTELPENRGAKHE